MTRGGHEAAPGVPTVAVTLVDQDPATTSSLGILNVSLGLVAGLAEHAAAGRVRLCVLAHEGLRDRLPAPGPGVELQLRPTPPLRWARVAWDLFGAATALRRTGTKHHLFPKGFLPLRATGGKTHALVHDRMFAHYRARGWRMPGLRQAFFARLQDRTLRTADQVLTTSRAVAAEIAPLRPGPILPIGVGPTSAPLPPQAPATPPPPGAPIVFLASPHPHKRTTDTIAWLLQWRATTAAPRPVVGLGRLPDGAAWPDDPAWILHPRLDSSDYARQLQQAAALIYLSSYEGYGLPPREALAAGIRTLASDLPVHREHLPAEALLPDDTAAGFAAHLDRILSTPPPALPWPTPPWHEVTGRWLASLANLAT